jgi:RNA-binding protein NOB1
MSEESKQDSNQVYHALVVDSGPIIRLTGLTALRDCASTYYTVPAVLQEIRDAKARQHLQQLPFELKTREASPEGIAAVVDFSRQTGDYQSLSSVDLQVLGLLYDLEREGCQGDVRHIRTTPKRTVGVGRVEFLASDGTKKSEAKSKEATETEGTKQVGTEYFTGGVVPKEQPQIESAKKKVETPAETKTAPTSWAALLNPTASTPLNVTETVTSTTEQAKRVSFNTMKEKSNDIDGQFSDAEEEEDDSSCDDSYTDSDKDISDEECDVYILDPEEVEAKKQVSANDQTLLKDELEEDFPSLAASLQVPYEGSDEEGETGKTPAMLKREKAEKNKLDSLKPVTKSGKLYNSFRHYSDIMKPKAKTTTATDRFTDKVSEEMVQVVSDDDVDQKTDTDERKDHHSRIIGGTTMAGQGTEVDDDGEGWITSQIDIRKMKAAGRLNPTQNPGELDEKTDTKLETGPPICQRTACTTTDFAMQNVILQMNLELLSVDGIKVRRLKSWVTRCGACFTVFADGENVGPVNTKRMFCSRCGSDMLQRVAASVDGKTGRLRLHLSKKYKTSLRGTKFSLPKPGTGNRFQGDLLLREDQLLMGAWNQKAKQRSGGKARSSAQSMFGSDIASTVGCNAKSINSDDIRVGFGRRNPNATKHGRERRGKKKKTPDRACGLRRY